MSDLINIPSFYTKNVNNSQYASVETKTSLIEVPTFFNQEVPNETYNTIKPMACYENCEYTCMTTGEDFCQTTCEKSCQTTCQKSCQSTCERGCQSACETGCESACEIGCLGCLSVCEHECQYSCLDHCQMYCQDWCEVGCQYCEDSSCQSNCEITCEVCQTGCMIGCQNCMDQCERVCQDWCEISCQNCQTSCQVSVQEGSATFSISNYEQTTAIGLITNLQHPANQYSQFAMTVRLGSSSGSLVTTETWTSTSNGSTTQKEITGLQPNTTYWVIGYATFGGVQYALNSVTFKTKQKPGVWEWEYSIYQGGAFWSTVGKTGYVMRATHWNTFTTEINKVRIYKNLPEYVFTTATSNAAATTVTICINQAITALNEMLPSGSKMSSIVAGNKVTAKIFTDLRDKFNSIIQ